MFSIIGKRWTSSLIDRETKIIRILELHKRWLYREPGGVRADFEFMDLHGIDFEGADLRNANLKGTDLRGAILRNADLRNADLRTADVRSADLRNADLRNADLKDADFYNADIIGVDLRDTNLTDTKNIPFIPMACPDSGAFTAWKMCESELDNENRWVIVKLLIPEDAKRLSSTGRKCRADKAIVQEIQTKDGKHLENIKVWSMYDSDFTYSVGETVTPKSPFCEDRWQECVSGIHFFINRQEAVDY